MILSCLGTPLLLAGGKIEPRSHVGFFFDSGLCVLIGLSGLFIGVFTQIRVILASTKDHNKEVCGSTLVLAVHCALSLTSCFLAGQRNKIPAFGRGLCLLFALCAFSIIGWLTTTCLIVCLFD